MTAVWHLPSRVSTPLETVSQTMINDQFGDIDAYRAAIRPPPRRGRLSARRFFPNMRAASGFWADCGSTGVRHPVAPRDLQVIDEDPNRQNNQEDRCLL
jgi:hypothetical protein